MQLTRDGPASEIKSNVISEQDVIEILDNDFSRENVIANIIMIVNVADETIINTGENVAKKAALYYEPRIANLNIQAAEWRNDAEDKRTVLKFLKTALIITIPVSFIAGAYTGLVISK